MHSSDTEKGVFIYFIIISLCKIYHFVNSEIAILCAFNGGALKVPCFLIKISKLLYHTTDSRKILFYLCSGNGANITTNYYFMHVNVYLSFDHMNRDSKVFCRRVQCPKAFEYDAFVRVMRSIFGKDIVIEFIVA